MKKVIFLFTSIVFSIFSFGACASNLSSSADTSNRNPNPSPQNQNAVVDSNAPANQSNVVNAAQTDSPATSSEVENYTDAATALDAGKKFFEDNEFEKSAAALEQAVKLDSTVGEAHFQLAVAYENLEKEKEAQKAYNDAIKIYQKHLKKNPQDAAANYTVGLAYNKINEDLKAEKALRQAVKSAPEDSEYQFELGQVLIKLAQYDEAVGVLKKALQLDPENLRIESALDRAASGKKRVDAAKPKDKPQEKPQERLQERLRERPKEKPLANKEQPTPPTEEPPNN